MTEYLVGSAIVLGYYKVLSGKGMTDEQVGQFCYQVSAHRFDDDSRIYRWFAKEVGWKAVLAVRGPLRHVTSPLRGRLGLRNRRGQRLRLGYRHHPL